MELNSIVKDAQMNGSIGARIHILHCVHIVELL
jgi:hypothetical protein